MTSINWIFRVATVFIGTFAAGLAGMIFVGSGVGGWYAGLIKPAFTPTEIVFPIVWTILYITMALACTLVWSKDPQNAHTEGWVRFYFIGLLFNIGWTIFFFGYHNLTLAFLDTLVLGFFVMGLTVSASELDKKVVYLMLPYCLWILFALYLTAEIWLLN